MLASRNRKKAHSTIASLYANQERVYQIKAEEIESMTQSGDMAGAKEIDILTSKATAAIQTAITVINELLKCEEEDE